MIVSVPLLPRHRVDLGEFPVGHCAIGVIQRIVVQVPCKGGIEYVYDPSVSVQPQPTLAVLPKDVLWRPNLLGLAPSRSLLFRSVHYRVIVHEPCGRVLHALQIEKMQLVFLIDIESDRLVWQGVICQSLHLCIFPLSLGL